MIIRESERATKFLTVFPFIFTTTFLVRVLLTWFKWMEMKMGVSAQTFYCDFEAAAAANK